MLLRVYMHVPSPTAGRRSGCVVTAFYCMCGMIQNNGTLSLYLLQNFDRVLPERTQSV